MKRFSLVSLLIMITFFLSAQDIKSIRIYKEGWEMSLPMIRLNSSDKVVLDFDIIGDETFDFEYIIEHCNADWEKSDLLLYEYMEGFEKNPLLDYEQSLNTLINYTHYKLSIPNQDVNLLKTGNYKLKIFNSSNGEFVFEREFYVFENEVELLPNVVRANSSAEPEKFQELRFKINLLNYKVGDPYNDIRVDVMLNKDYNRKKEDITPRNVDGQIMIYEDNSLYFLGGREYRHFQIRNYENYLEGIERVEFVSPYHIIYLDPIDANPYAEYKYEEDVNGGFKFDMRGAGVMGKGENVDLTADYKKVVFRMPWSFPITDGAVCITGRFNNWGCDSMEYNYEKTMYQAQLILKQGYYNYMLVLKDDSGIIKYDYFEPSSYKTENDYYFFIYDVSPSERYDKIIGIVYYNTAE